MDDRTLKWQRFRGLIRLADGEEGAQVEPDGGTETYLSIHFSDQPQGGLDFRGLSASGPISRILRKAGKLRLNLDPAAWYKKPGSRPKLSSSR